MKLEGLGTFGPSIEGKKNGAVSVKAAVEGGLDTLIEGVHMNFTPENVKGEKLTSRAMKDVCVFSAGKKLSRKRHFFCRYPMDD